MQGAVLVGRAVNVSVIAQETIFMDTVREEKYKERKKLEERTFFQIFLKF